MNVYKKRAIFTRRNKSNVYRMFFWVILILGGIWLIRGVQRGDVKPLFQPTSTPTRLAQSYALEGDAKFISGQLDDIKDADGNVKSTGAITAYREAAKVDPTNAKLMADLARIQVYSSALKVGDVEIKTRLAEALNPLKEPWNWTRIAATLMQCMHLPWIGMQTRHWWMKRVFRNF